MFDEPGAALLSFSHSGNYYGNYTCINTFKTYIGWRPDPRPPGVLKTFVVKYNNRYFDWGWKGIAQFKENWSIQDSKKYGDRMQTTEGWNTPLWTGHDKDAVNDEDWPP